MDEKSLTDEIYQELVDGLKTGLDWTAFLARYGGSKGPLYNAIARFFHDMEVKVKSFSEVQANLEAAGLKLDSLDREIKKAESRFVALKEQEKALNEGIETLETKLTEKSELLEYAGELGKLGFDIARLRQLRETLNEIGAKHGLKGKEAIGKFFAELKDYDAEAGFEQEIQRLATTAATKKLEAENWQAQTDNLSRRYKELSEAITVAQSLRNQGVREEQIISWNKSLIKLGGAEGFEKGLNRYRSVQALLAARRREVKKLDLKIAKLNGEVNTLRQEKAEIGGSIKALRSSAIAEIERVSKTGIETVNAQKREIKNSVRMLKEEMANVSQTGLDKIDKLGQAGASSIQAVGGRASSELKEALSLVDKLSRRTLEVGVIIGQLENKQEKSGDVKEKIEKLVTGIERAK